MKMNDGLHVALPTAVIIDTQHFTGTLLPRGYECKISHRIL